MPQPAALACGRQGATKNGCVFCHCSIARPQLYVPNALNPPPKIYEVLYVSTIDPTAPISVVADIAAKARAWNLEHDLTGLLIFNGTRLASKSKASKSRCWR
jgi:Sensors of blue-light using FAD